MREEDSGVDMRTAIGFVLGIAAGYALFGETLYLGLKQYDPSIPEYLLIAPFEEANCWELSKVMGKPQCYRLANYQHWLNVAKFAIYTGCSVVRDPNGEFNLDELTAACQFQ